MAQYETTGGGYVDDGARRVERKVVVSTGGKPINPPASDSGWPLSNVNVSQEAGGVLRGVFEFSQGGEGGASYNQYGKRIELTGGTREVPIQTHAAFSKLGTDELALVDKALENIEPATWAIGAENAAGDFETFNEKQQLLYNFRRKGVEYVLAPAVVGRVSEIESVLPSLKPIAKVADPSELNAPDGTFWICTAITATPIGTRYEVTREYTLNFSDWDDVKTLYGWD